ncbi:M36 family metallopeptidase [Solirubrobacter sp. CPCC 204708]|uniref:M36 family metallopeptidase n=1 Tax=Solirubrobacter deserti TaxID=2282478 RepID=A0ABT4RQY4_9ACTN|nr:M36 family metallopeptidase [Solirubrobacter deserti]MBE2320107.1 M36 family metallopeptidase [Solirubrobacter deserti]MDA0140954.1 M36 family metallopeptidase [Solirubrobacter deserti]
MLLLAACTLPASARADVEVLAGKLDGPLTRPAEGAAATIGLRYVREHRSQLGLTAADLETLDDPSVETIGDVRQVRWRHEIDGIEVADAELRVNVDSDGRLINVLGSPPEQPADTTPRLPKPQPDADLTIYDGRLGWRYRDGTTDLISDADTGKVLKRTELTRDATARVWENHPGATHGGQEVVRPLPVAWLSTDDRLFGPFVHTYTDLDGSNTAAPTEEVRPDPYPFSPVASCAICGWDGTNGTRLRNREQNAVQAFYLVNRFREHALSRLGFDFKGDRLLVEASDTAALSGNAFDTNNANMYTPPVGQSPRMQLYLWRSPYRTVNAGDDASIVFHEYAHGLTSRLVTDSDGVVALGSWQSGAMGEGWSDFYAKDFLLEQFPLLDDSGVRGDVSMGAYVDAVSNTMRTQGLDCPVGLDAPRCPGGGYTYGDFADGLPDWHRDGEIWAQTLWDLRGEVGMDDARVLVTRALPLAPPEPSFLDMRNAILQADQTHLAGRHHARIWKVFAARGMGLFASTTGGQDTEPVENFDDPTDAGAPGTITGRVTDAVDGAPVAGVTVSVGGLSAGPDARVATTRADGTYTLPNVPEQADATLVVRGTTRQQLETGFEQAFVTVDVVAGTTVTADAAVRRNWASIRAGATLQSSGGSENAGSGCGPKQALDGHTGSTWSMAARSPLVVMLPRTINVRGIGIDPREGCVDDWKSALRGYRVEVSGDGMQWRTAREGEFTFENRLQMNRFAISEPDVRYVRLTPLSNLGGATWTDVTEFAVYGHAHAETDVLSGPTVPDSTATFTFGGEGAARFECRVDAGAWEACTSPKTYTGLASGEHLFEVRAFNRANEPDPTPAQRAFTIDALLPQTKIESAPPATTREPNPGFTFSGGSSYECAWNGVAGPCARALGDGTHTLTVAARNAHGLDPSPASYTFTVDRTAPLTAISAATVAGRIATFAFASPDLTAVTHTCALDGVTAPCTSPRVYAGVGDGPHTFTVTATDAAGNTASATRTVTVDATPPETMIEWAPPPILTARDFALAFRAGEDATFVCSIDGAAATPCTSPLALSGLGDGAHSVVVTAIDAAGNADPTPARSDFTVVVPGVPAGPSPTPSVTPRATATPAPRAALATVAGPKTVSRRSGKVKLTLKGVRGAKVAVRAKVGTRVVGRATKTLSGSTLTLSLTLDKKRLKAGTSVSVRVQATGAGLTPVSRTLKIRVKA